MCLKGQIRSDGFHLENAASFGSASQVCEISAVIYLFIYLFLAVIDAVLVAVTMEVNRGIISVQIIG